MKVKLNLAKSSALFVLLFGFNHQLSMEAQGTAFTYQGRLNDGANPANGKYDLTFALFNAVSGGAQSGSTLQLNGVGATNGLFTTSLDFGSTPINGTALWLQIATRPAGSSTFTNLQPRQPLTPAPYSIYAESAGSLPGLSVQSNTNGAPNVIGGSSVNYVAGGVVGATIAGGGATNYNGLVYSNSVTADFGTVSGGFENTASNKFATVSGGHNNTASGFESMIAGGSFNTASGFAGAVGGGSANTASGDDSTVNGGSANTAGNDLATVGGGYENIASGYAATIPGGYANFASGDYSFAAGRGAQALYQGDFVWADNNGGSFASTTPNQFCVRAAGGVVLAADVSISGGAAYHNLSLSGGNSTGFLYGSYPKWGDGVHLGYNYYADANGTGHVINSGGPTSRISVGYGEIDLAVGAVNGVPTNVMLRATATGVCVNGTVSNCSDRNVKQDFEPVIPSQILDRVLQLPLSEWSYKMDAATRHIGPMAQDFYAAFNIGPDDKHITTVDESGVALAAIQGLNQKLEQKETEIAELKQRLEALEKIIRDQKPN